MSWAILCDFDHTITTEDVTDQLLEKLAAPEWREIEMQWEKGFIGSRACMQQQIALLNATKEQVDAVADGIAIDRHFKTFAAFCAEKHLPLVIVSDGLDYVIERILGHHRIPHASVLASHLEYNGGGQWQLAVPFASENCTSQASTCKCEMSRQLRVAAHADNILYIGDGRSDYCVSMEEADFILAKDSLLTYCQQQQLPHRAFKSFAQATRIVAEMTQRREQPLHTEEQLYA